MPADLHVHTTFSDSTLTPEDVVAQCVAAQIDTVAVTDHDTTAGVAPAAEAGRKAGVRVVPGVEMTAYEDDLEIHIVGLFIDPGHGGFREVTGRTLQARYTRVHKMVELLRRQGLEISVDDVLHIAGSGAPGRPHVAQALVRRGQVGSISDAFRYYIGNNGPAHVPKHLLSPPEAADVIHAAGGVSIIGHPGTGLRDALIRRMVEDGIHGLEAYHPLHAPADVERYLGMARELGALVSGGSDSHGGLRGETRIGAVRLDDDLVDLLEQRAEAVRAGRKT